MCVIKRAARNMMFISPKAVQYMEHKGTKLLSQAGLVERKKKKEFVIVTFGLELHF